MPKFLIKSPAGNINCRLYCGDRRAITHLVLCFHGFGGHKDNNACALFAERFLAKKKTGGVLCFDFPCHGEDIKKKISLADCLAYTDAVVQHIREEWPQAELSAYGTSFGGYLALLYLQKAGGPFARTALRCPAVDMRRVLESIMTPENKEQLALGKDTAVGFDVKITVTPAFLRELEENDLRSLSYLDWADDILLLHGTKDEVVPIAETESFADDNVIEFEPVENADHRFMDKNIMAAATARCIEFILS